LPVKKLSPITFFAISLAFIEAVVVVYLRELYYPEGFYFPLKLIPPKILLTEILREIATIVVITAVSLANGKKQNHKIRYISIYFWCMGYILLCMVKDVTQLAAEFIYLGYTFSDSGDMGCTCPGASPCINSNDNYGNFYFIYPD